MRGGRRAVRIRRRIVIGPILPRAAWNTRVRSGAAKVNPAGSPSTSAIRDSRGFTTLFCGLKNSQYSARSELVELPLLGEALVDQNPAELDLLPPAPFVDLPDLGLRIGKCPSRSIAIWV